jgi:hypothetical protein
MQNLTPADLDWIKQLERMGVERTKSELDNGRISPTWFHLTSSWLSQQERLAQVRRDASNAEQIALARRASEAAERAATAAELQATEARRANRRATIALVIAIASMAVSAIVAAIGIWITHMDTAK